MNLIDVQYFDPLHGQVHVRAFCPSGTGGGYDVYVNGYFKGQIVKYHVIGWTSFVKLGILSQDDVDAILDVIELNSGQ